MCYPLESFYVCTVRLSRKRATVAKDLSGVANPLSFGRYVFFLFCLYSIARLLDNCDDSDGELSVVDGATNCGIQWKDG